MLARRRRHLRAHAAATMARWTARATARGTARGDSRGARSPLRSTSRDRRPARSGSMAQRALDRGLEVAVAIDLEHDAFAIEQHRERHDAHAVLGGELVPAGAVPVEELDPPGIAVLGHGCAE